MKELLARKINLTKQYLFNRYCENFPQLVDYSPYENVFILHPVKPEFQFINLLTGKDGQYLSVEKRCVRNNFPKSLNSVGIKILSDIGLPEREFGIMGILNVTPDSFSDGGKYDSFEAALRHAGKLLEDGADILDIGGESTRPGAPAVIAEEELKRVIPVIKEISTRFPKCIISVDTTKSEVAEKAIEAGAAIVNDISCFDLDGRILDICAANSVPLVGMHMKGTPKTMQNKPFYNDVIDEILQYFVEKLELLEKRNFRKFIIDPGIGFGKRVSDNFEIIDRCDEFKIFGYPVLIGLSKKSYIGKSLKLDVDERDNATVISEVLAVKNGADLIRTHNVKNLFQARELLKFYKTPDIADNV